MTMTRGEITAKLVSILAARLMHRPEDVQAESNLVRDLGADSLDIVESMMAVEEEFGIEITDDDWEKLNTVGDIAQYIEENFQP